MALSSDDLAGLVDLDRGTVAGHTFTDDDIYEIELEHVFAHTWCFLCDTDSAGRTPAAHEHLHQGEPVGA